MPIHIRPVASNRDVELARSLIREYAESLGVDLSFQDFAAEIADLPGAYVPPKGALLLGELDGVVEGCVALRPSDGAAAELKRLYVRPAGRGHGLGRALTMQALGIAHRAGYRTVRLDTLPGMAEARALYRDLGFREIPSYRHNPIAGTAFLEYDLSAWYLAKPT